MNKKLLKRKHDTTSNLASYSFETGLAKLREQTDEENIELVVSPWQEKEANLTLDNFYGGSSGYSGTFAPYVFSKIKVKISREIESVDWFLVTKDAVYSSSGDNS